MLDVFRIGPMKTGPGQSTVEIPDASAEIWTKPSNGLTIDPANPLTGIGGHFGSKDLVVMGDGSVRFLSPTEQKRNPYAMFTRAAGD